MSTADKTDEKKPEAEPESKSIFQEFREFIARGNAIDLAVGVVMGAAFNKIVTSIVNDLVMPPIGFIVGGVDFRNLAIPLKPGTPAVPATANSPAVAEVPEVAIRYGAFLNILIEFLIVSASVFFAVKVVNAMMAYRIPYLTAAEELAAAEKRVEEEK
jgi:large conductance mechanosensitive channel